ncbi:MAG: hypothetical protein J2P37_30590, partial [Ktedonobacteraceae bacterium]|nr:hypothetical protein [Ktedonobacteraceae bacterium]
MKRRKFLKGAITMAGLVPGSLLLNASSPVLTHTPPRALRVASIKELGVVGKPETVLVRDGGATIQLGGQLFWMFGDTLVLNDMHIRSNTAALASLAKPLETHEALDGNGRPYQCVPFTAEEQAYNDSTGAPDDRIAIWPTSAINYDGQGLIFSYKLHVKPG